MTEESTKVNPYIIVIVVLVIVVGVLAYNQWGKGLLPSSENDQGEPGTTSDVDTEVTEGDFIIGKEDAPVTIIEYFSYFCGYCKRFHDDTYPEIVKNYIGPGKVKFVLRIYPPLESGVAVLCANDQGKFLEYHDSLFENSGSIQTIEDLETLAENIGLDKGQFSQCFNSQKYVSRAQQWYEQGVKDFEAAGVPQNQQGTPAFIVNGEMLVGAQPYENFVEVIERKLSE